MSLTHNFVYLLFQKPSVHFQDDSLSVIAFGSPLSPLLCETESVVPNETRSKAILSLRLDNLCTDYDEDPKHVMYGKINRLYLSATSTRLMELTDSTHPNPDPSRSVLVIDLNEVPSSSESPRLDALSVVRSFHDNLTPPDGGPADLPGGVSVCAACGSPVVQGSVLVCDGCELGFHLGCADIRGQKEMLLSEWMCGKCVSNAVPCNRWPLGAKTEAKVNKRGNFGVLDINFMPSSGGEGEDLSVSRKHSPGDNSFGGNPFGVPVTSSKLLNVGNRAGFQKASDVMRQSVKLRSEDLFQHEESRLQNFREFDVCPLSEALRSRSLSSTRLPPNKVGKMYMESLREYIRERCGGILEEGWRVEFRNSMSKRELDVVYCAPDGKTFESMSEVSCYLGLTPNADTIGRETGIEIDSSLRRLLLSKRRKSARLEVANGVAKNEEDVMRGFVKDQLSDIQNLNFVGESVNYVKLSDAVSRGTSGSASKVLSGGLPVQYEDFFVLSVGKIDARPSYHIANQIWPIGYKSCWHDKITGSLFICDVLDGGDSGPVFKVKRSSCSVFPIPIGSTVLYKPNIGQPDSQNEGNNFHRNYTDEDFSVLMMLSEPSPPKEHDILSCFGSTTFDCSNDQTSKDLHVEANPRDEKSRYILSDNYMWVDEIGEFSVEESSSSSAWRMISEKLINACQEAYAQTGNLRFCCKHASDATSSSYWDIRAQEFDEKVVPLAQFCGSCESSNIPSFIRDHRELEISSENLLKWLDQDRFGLDVEFVQEILEQLPGAIACPLYVFLKERSAYSSFLTVGNGLLLAKTKDGVDLTNEETDDSFESCQEPKIPKFQCSLMDNHFIPPGKPISSRLPPQLLSDAVQVWDYLCRFHDVLELSEPFSFEELEKELINPWFDNSDLEKFRRGSQESLQFASHRTDGTSCNILSSKIKFGPPASAEDPHAFIHMETAEMKEAAQAKLASATYSRCNGFALTKIHNSLLRVLISELQSKVAAIIDPNFDTGESKSKRGRKKDMDHWIAAIRTKINILPLNELTWPELVRRYILAVLSMDGRLDSADITTRESGKIFRCLQGDGGVLCGSLTGVAGIEADALLLAEATQNIFGSLNREHDTLAINDVESEDYIDKRVTVGGGNLPEWAKVLEPVRKLPTNVGARIRKCIYEALDKGPPEWAKKVLEHSISKGVYKGNASGPTKKAVLSVLADLHTRDLQQKPDKEQKKKRFLSISDIVMKRCRIVLRRVAAADDAKIFCNLLERKFINCSDSDDEGLLGSPAMVSRPLDFRTIDLKLAAGAYGGSHEAFHEDVREFWTNVCVAYKDQPDLIKLAETLSDCFDSMYEKEVLTQFQKLVQYSKSECLSAQSKEEIDQMLVSACEIPKAPWEEGVCKVCGIDRDDDNVLLCDKCDAEYHKYCLNPPLARIPEGNWYCPSCVAGKRIAQEESDSRWTFLHRKKYQGEFTHVHLDSLAQVAALMEEREYWELGVAERTFLLKFLCDELLNSVLVRQHLEQCAETSTELLQKLRSLSVELKALKYKEESLGAKAAKVEKSFKAVGDVTEIDNTMDFKINDKCISQHLSQFECGRTPAGADNFKEHTSVSENRHGNSQCMKPMVVEDQLEDNQAVVSNSQIHGNSFIHVASDDDCFRWKDVISSETPKQGINNLDRDAFSGSLENHLECDTPTLPSSENLQGYTAPLVIGGTNVGVNDPSVDVNNSQSKSLELNLVRNEILRLQNLISRTESELLKQSVRREFLGSDSFGRLYWVLAGSSTCHSVISDRNVELQQGGKIVSCGFPESISVFRTDALCGADANRSSGSSRDSTPCLYEHSDDSVCFTWVSYQSDTEIKNLVDCLQDTNPGERELKESILHWRKLIFQGSQQSGSQLLEGPQMVLSRSRDGEISSSFNCLNTMAASLLETKFGTCFDPETTNFSKSRFRKGKGIVEQKMYRCECLEPIWQSRYHCLSCHRTFFNNVELDGHSDGKCNSAPPVPEKSKENNDTSKGKGMMKSEIGQGRCRDEIYNVDASSTRLSQLSSRLIRHQNDGSVCPFDYEDICSKFVTKDSNKELVKEIGLIGSNGMPTFVPSISPYLSDSTLMLVPLQETEGIQDDTPKTDEQLTFSQDKMKIIAGHDGNLPDNPSRSAVEHIDEKSSSHCCAPLSKFGNIVPKPSLRALTGKAVYILQQLKINLLDMDAALPEEALKPSKGNSNRRCAWRKFVKSAERIYEMVQATIAFEDMIKSEYLGNTWLYWSSLSAAAKISTLSSLALRIYSLDAAITYSKTSSLDVLQAGGKEDQNQPSSSDPTEKYKMGRKSNKKRKERES